MKANRLLVQFTARNLSKLGFGLSIIIMLIVIVFVVINLRALIESNSRVSHTLTVLRALDKTLSLLSDVETSQSGYIITGEERFLEPYHAAVSPKNGISHYLQELRQLTSDNPHEQRHLDLLDPLVREKLAFVQETIDLRRNAGFDAVQGAVLTDQGRRTMEDIRQLLADIHNEEKELLRQESNAAAASLQYTLLSLMIGAGLSLLLLSLSYYMLHREVNVRWQAEEALRQLADDLDQRVAERTAELAASESNFRDLADSALVGISTTTLKGEILYVNQTLAHMMGFDTPEAMIQSGSSARWGDPQSRQAFLDVLQKTGKVEGYETVLLNSSGEPLNVLFSAQIRNEQLSGTVLDITERKRAEELLAASERRFRGLIENAPDGITVVDAQGTVIYVSPSIERILGYSQAEALGRSAIEYVHPQDGSHLLWQLARLTRKPGKALVQYRFRHKDGSWRWLESAISNLIAEPSAEGIVFNYRDITARKQAEEQLQASTARATVLAELSQALAEITGDYQGVLNLVARRIAELIGDFCAIRLVAEDGVTLLPAAVHHVEASAQELIRNFVSMPQRADEGISAQVFRTGKAVLLPFVPPEAFQAQAPAAFLPMIQRLNMHSVMLAPLRVEGKIIGVLSMTRDQTPQAYTEDDKLFLQDLADRAALTIANAGHFTEIRELNAALELRVVERTARLAEAKQEAERANQAKSEFLSRMSHELRTPMNSILGFAQLLKMDELTPDQMGSLEQILKSGRHLLDLINEVLDIARIESGRMMISPEPVHLDEALQSAAELIRPLADQRGISIEIRIPSSRDVFVTADRQRLKQVLLNLLSNAVKYNREGGQIYVTANLLVNGYLHLAVRDTGNGIPPEKMERLFVPFDRLELDPAFVEGTGLGLALSKGLVEAMGGRIGAQSVLGVGSTFWLDLKLTTQQKEAIVMAEVDDYLRDSPGLRKGLVLYVEDNLSNIQLIEKILARLPDVKLITAMQGRLAMDLARQHQPSLILLDLHLPDMHGSDVLKWLRAEPETREIPIVVMSADATPGQIEKMLAAGARVYLTKPIDVKEFLKVVGEILGS